MSSSGQYHVTTVTKHNNDLKALACHQEYEEKLLKAKSMHRYIKEF